MTSDSISDPERDGRGKAIASAAHVLGALGLAAVCLTLSAVVLVVGFALSQSARLTADGPEPKRWLGKDFHLRDGGGRVLGRYLVITSPSPQGKMVAVADGAGLDAGDYPLISYDIRGLGADSQAALFWRTKDRPRELGFARLPMRGAGTGPETINLSGIDAWDGVIVELGVSVRHEAKSPVVVRSVMARPPLGPRRSPRLSGRAASATPGNP